MGADHASFFFRAWDSTKGFPGEGPPRARTSELGRYLAKAFQAEGRPRRASLLQGGIPETLDRYNRKMDEFQSWLSVRDWDHLDVLVNLPSTRTIADVTGAYVQWLFEEERPISDARYTVAALQHRYPHLKGMLRIPWGAVREWQLLEPGLPRIPLPSAVLHACAVLAATWGWWRTASCLLINMHTWARPAEMANARLDHFVLPSEYGDMTLTGKGVWAIWKSKTSRHGFVIQHVVLSCPIVLGILRVLKEISPRGAPLLPYSQNVFQSRLKTLLQRLGIPVGLFTLGSIRAGGATEDWLVNENLGRVQFRGRWRDPKSVQHYIQEATACLAALAMSRRTANLVATLDGLLGSLFPPSAALMRRSRD